MRVIARHQFANLLAALEDTPVVLLTGARQVGKSTLAKAAAERTGAAYLTLDDATVLASASSDPVGFVRNLPGAVVIDEVQRAPELMLALKASVDADRRSGRFLLTGSADVLTLPRVADSLAGRMDLLRLWPLSQGELDGALDDFPAKLFEGSPPTATGATDEADLRERVLRGGYPEAVARTAARRRTAWFEAYVTTILQRDVQALSNIEGLREMPRLLQILAARTSTLQNLSALSREIGLPQSTLKRYLALLEVTFLLQAQPAWAAGATRRLTKAPKGLITDVGLVSSLLDIDTARLAADRTLFGQLLESFVTLELYKQLGWSRVRARLYHFRSYSGSEVDVVLARPDGTLAGIEVKASATVSNREFGGLRTLKEEVGKRFRAGVVLYLGDEVLPFGDGMWAAPVHALWSA